MPTNEEFVGWDWETSDYSTYTPLIRGRSFNFTFLLRWLMRQPNRREGAVMQYLSVASILLQLVSRHELKLKVIAEPFDCLSIWTSNMVSVSCTPPLEIIFTSFVLNEALLQFLPGCTFLAADQNEWSNLKPTKTYLQHRLWQIKTDLEWSTDENKLLLSPSLSLDREMDLWTWLDFVWLSEAGRSSSVGPEICVSDFNWNNKFAARVPFSVTTETLNWIETWKRSLACQRNSWSMVIAAKST